MRLRNHQSTSSGVPTEARCLGCGAELRTTDPTTRVCQPCRFGSLQRLAAQLCPDFVPTPENLVYALWNEMMVLEPFWGYGENYEVMGEAVWRIARREKAEVFAVYGTDDRPTKAGKKLKGK